MTTVRRWSREHRRAAIAGLAVGIPIGLVGMIVMDATEDFEHGFFIGWAVTLVIAVLLGVVYGYLFKCYGEP